MGKQANHRLAQATAKRQKKMCEKKEGQAEDQRRLSMLSAEEKSDGHSMGMEESY